MIVRAESGEDCECTQQSTVPERPPATIIVPRRSSHCIVGRRIILVWICMHTGRSRHTHTTTAATATATTKHDKYPNSRPQLHSKTVRCRRAASADADKQLRFCFGSESAAADCATTACGYLVDECGHTQVPDTGQQTGIFDVLFICCSKQSAQPVACRCVCRQPTIGTPAHTKQQHPTNTQQSQSSEAIPSRRLHTLQPLLCAHLSIGAEFYHHPYKHTGEPGISRCRWCRFCTKRNVGWHHRQRPQATHV
jgi:hypothetical protein